MLVFTTPLQPLTLLNLAGYFVPMKPFRYASGPVKREFKRLLVCLVTKGDQPDVVKRSVTPIQDGFMKVNDRIEFHVLTEGPRLSTFQGLFPSQIQVHGVPAEYTPSKAKFKARSLEWFRINMQLKDDDWVLHLDEETLIDEFLLKTVVDFITKQDTMDMGVGVIHYNGAHYWRTPISQAGDISRVLGDYGRIQMTGNYLHNAAIGIHGAFHLMSGKLENAITWDTDSLTEDYWVCLHALDMKLKMGWIPAIARELSPGTIGDYVRQRRRWFSGIRGMTRRPMGMLTIFTCVWQTLEPLFFLYWVCTRSFEQAVPSWFYALTTFQFVHSHMFSCVGLFIQDWDAGLSLKEMVWTQLIALVCKPVASWLEGWAAVSSIFQPAHTFYIVNKR
jgi:cellulose synthase/poly-beta-1,6-N-acetylglucosamine synthase-like glycosyltransferase